MRKTLLVVCGVTAVLSGIAAQPGAIFIGLILLIVPGLILIAAPNLFILSFATLIGSYILAPIGRVASYLLPGVLIAIPCFILPKVWNAPFERQIEALTADDRDFNGFRKPVDTIALLTPRIPRTDQTGEQCSGTCQRLLYDGSVRAVLAGPSLEGSAEPAFRRDEKVTRYRIEHRAICPDLKIASADSWPREAPGITIASMISDRIKSRIATGECLIAEPASLSDADAIFVRRHIRWGQNPFFKPAFSRDVDTITASRISAYQASDGGMTEVFRRTQVQAELIGTPLLIGSSGHCSSGACYTRQDFLRTDLNIGGNLEEWSFFVSKSGLNVSAPEDVSVAALRSALSRALADASLPSGAPQFAAVDVYLKRLASFGSNDDQDVALLREIIVDPRATEFFSLASAVAKLGSKAAPLAMPLIERIASDSTPRQNETSLSYAIGLLPPGAAAPILPQLRDLAANRNLRARSWPALTRLADGGAASVPLLLDLLQTKVAPGEDASNLWVAGARGLCLMGRDGAEAAPQLLSLIINDERFLGGDSKRRYLGPLGLLAVEALVRMDKTAELNKLSETHEFIVKPVREKVEGVQRQRYPHEVCRY